MPDGAVVDTTVFAAILLREPGHRDLSARLGQLARVRAAPFFRFECANVLWKQRAAVSSADSDAALALLWALPVEDGFELEHAAAALDIGRSHALPFYDCAFLALAQHEGLPLWTLDCKQGDVARALGVRLV